MKLIAGNGYFLFIMALAEIVTEQKIIPAVESERKTDFDLPPVYQELLSIVPENPDFSQGREGIQTPSSDTKEAYRQAATQLKERFAGMQTKEEKLAYLGMVQFTGGAFEQGTNTPTPDKRMGARYNESPAKDNHVDYPFHLSSTVVPNVLYEVAVADMGGYQVRINQSPTHLHPAVNANQENAARMVSWLGDISGLDLRLPTEAEWDYAAAVVSDSREFIYGTDKPVKSRAQIFDPENYHTLPVDVRLSPNSVGINIGGNVWEMTTPDLETDFKRIPSEDGTLVEGYSYAAKGGGFQHCSLGPRRGPRMMCDPLLRSPSLGFRMALSETRDENPDGGWRKRTPSLNGHVLYREMDHPVSNLQLVQTKNTLGLSVNYNGDRIVIRPDQVLDPKPPARSIGLTNGTKTVYQAEHLLAALNGMGIWNVRAVLDGGNAPPAADYSSIEFVRKIQEAGLFPGALGQIEVLDDIEITNGNSRCIIKPGPIRYGVDIDFANPFIGRQTAAFNPETDDFATEIAPARTFRETIVDEAEWQHQINDRLVGLPAYENLSEAPLLVATKDGWQMPLRFTNEPARHKLLDVMGDLALLGLPLKGDVSVEKPGHNFNLKIVRQLHSMLRENDPRIRLQKLT